MPSTICSSEIDPQGDQPSAVASAVASSVDLLGDLDDVAMKARWSARSSTVPPPSDPASRSSTIKLPAPAYSPTDPLDHVSPVKIAEMCALLRILERMISPSLQDAQRVHFTEDQLERMSAAQLASMIQRLSSRRLDEQRSSEPRYMEAQRALDEILARLASTVSPQMEEQRAERSLEHIRLADASRLGALVDRLTRPRYPGQEWVSVEERREEEMLLLEDRLLASGRGYEQQRFLLTSEKERDLFVDRLLGKVQRGRLVGQDASIPPMCSL